MRMKKMLLLVLLFWSMLNAKPGISQPVKKMTALVGVFDGRTPCQELAKQLEEKTTAECIKIKWRLILYKDSITGEPTTYELIGFVHKKGNPGTGQWHIIKENATTTIYQLDRTGKKPLLFLKADDNILLFLDENKKIMVGNRDFSYTLNRINKKPG
jgi:hypothetical protein